MSMILRNRLTVGLNHQWFVWVIQMITISISDCTTDVVKDSIVGKFGLYSFRKRGNL